MVEQTVDGQTSPQTGFHPACVYFLVRDAIDFAAEIGVDLGLLDDLTQALLSPVEI